MTFTFTNPVTVGDMNNRITITAVQLAALSFNFDPDSAVAGQSIMAIVLRDPVSGYKHSIQYQDATALAAWQQVNTGNNSTTSVEQRVFSKLVADGKIPAGTLA